MKTTLDHGTHGRPAELEAELRRQICDIGRNLWNRGMVAANDGNISARLPNGRILCTPTGVSKGYLTPAMLPIVALDGTVVELGAGLQPSSEVRMHLRVYQVSDAVGAVVHAHPPYATAFAIKGEPLVGKMLPESIVAMPRWRKYSGRPSSGSAARTARSAMAARIIGRRAPAAGRTSPR